MANEPTCFVVMGFGKKTDFETGRTLDLDKSYENMIKPAVEDAGLTCIRADEIVHSGEIDLPMYEQLLNADVVVADLSTSNRNAFYELGVRHALRPYTTVVICEDGMKSQAFDVNHILVRQYHHLGEDIGSSEARRFSKLLTSAIVDILNKSPREKDSPVYTFLNRLRAPEIAAAIEEAANDGASSPPVKSQESRNITAEKTPTHSQLMKEAEDARKAGDWATAKIFLSTIRKNLKADNPDKEDSYILQRLALATYKAKIPDELTSLKSARDLLELLNPNDSNDPETLGLWGSIHKKLCEMSNDPDSLDKAINAYERGFYIRRDHYNGINYAYLLNLRASLTKDSAEAITDFILAKRARLEVIGICEKWMTENPLVAGKDGVPDVIRVYWASRYWVQVSLAEAYLGSGNEAKARELLDDAYSKVTESWMKESTESQIEKLRKLLSASPLQYIKEKSA